jgi:hypothetical protein
MGISTEGRTKIIVTETFGVNYCVAACDEQKIYNRIAAVFCENKAIWLSFAGISDLTPTFLNYAAGQLYGSFSAESIESNISFIDTSREDGIILRRAIGRMETHVEHAYSCRKTNRDVSGGEDA